MWNNSNLCWFELLDSCWSKKMEERGLLEMRMEALWTEKKEMGVVLSSLDGCWRKRG